MSIYHRLSNDKAQHIELHTHSDAWRDNFAETPSDWSASDEGNKPNTRVLRARLQGSETKPA